MLHVIEKSKKFEEDYFDKESNIKIGKNTKIEPGVVIYDDCQIGEDCIIGTSAVLKSNTKISLYKFLMGSITYPPSTWLFDVKLKLLGAIIFCLCSSFRYMISREAIGDFIFSIGVFVIIERFIISPIIFNFSKI